MSLPLDPQTLPIAATGFPAPIERHWDTLCRNNLGQLVDGNGVVLAIPAVQLAGQMTQEAERSVAGEARYANGWGNLLGYTVAFYKDSCGRVHLRGLAASGVVAAGTTIFALPSGYFPTTNPLAVLPVISNGAAAAIQITTAGNVQTLFGVSNVYLSFDGVSFDPRA